MIKRQCGLLAKGRLIGVQFEALLDGGPDGVYFTMARHANEMAEELREGLAALDVAFFGNSKTNQVFPILPKDVVAELEKDFFFYRWAAEKDGMIPIRLVTAWETSESDVKAFIAAVGKLTGKRA